MRILALLSQKGGSGKTTLAVHLAVAASADQSVALADTDPQGSATAWGRAREGRPPVVATAPASHLSNLVEAATVDRVDLLVVDTAPHTTPEAARVAQRADAILIPCRPSAFDLAAVGSAVEIARAAGVRAGLVLNACPPRAPETAEARESLASFGLPISPIEITERRAFARAVATGRAVTEFEAHGKAAEEIRALWRWIDDALLAAPSQDLLAAQGAHR